MLQRSALEQALLYVGAVVAVFVVLTGEIIVGERMLADAPGIELAESMR